MRREVAWAIIAGIVFGLVIAFGIVRVNSNLKPKGIATEASPTPQTNTSQSKITIDKPEQDDVITESHVTITGITKPQTVIIISAEEKDYMVTANDKGLFETEIDLVSGINQILVSDPDSLATEKLLVIYSSAFEEKEGDRLEKAANKPKAYLGVVTDITDSTIQVKTQAGEIKQISVSENVAVVKTDPTNKIVKLTDVAIGDFIVAMGYRNGNQVLNAQRILITPPVVEPKITVATGVGADVKPVKSTKIYPKASDLENESSIISITTGVSGKSLLRTVFIIDNNGQ